MRAWIIRVASLYAFNVVVLLLIDILMPQVRVGWAALWAALVLTVTTLWIKPVITRLLTSAADRRTAGQAAGRARTKATEYAVTFAVAAIVWILVAIFSGVRVHGFLWGYILPPLALLAAWALYDVIDDRLEATAGQVYDKATARRSAPAQAATPTPTAPPAAPSSASPASAAGARELNDGLTDEQRRLFDELG